MGCRGSVVKVEWGEKILLSVTFVGWIDFDCDFRLSQPSMHRFKKVYLLI